MTISLEQKFNITELASILDILNWRAKNQPNRMAYTFLVDGKTEGKCLTYQGLLQEAKAIAAKLQSLVLPGERVLLLYPSGLEFVSGFFGCLLAGVVAIPVNLPKKNQKMARLTSIIANAQSSLILTSESQLEALKTQFRPTDVTYLATDTLNIQNSHDWEPTQIKSNTLAFLQYTSGSTGTPKGVMVNHENLLETLRDLDLGWDHDENSRMVTWLPTFHDMGLIYGMLLPLYKGFPCYMLPSIAFLQRPICWLKAISNYGATHTAAPNFAYARCVDKITDDQLQDLNLSNWQVALNGAETVRYEILAEFAQKFAACGFKFSTLCPGYGLAEATLKVTAVSRNQSIQVCQVDKEALSRNQILFTEEVENSQLLVSCGQTEIETEIAIVNPHTCERCQPYEVGEIWVKGKSVAQGYWQRPEATEHTFKAVIADTLESPYLRTGDLGFLHQGQLYVTGRLKDMIIIRGGNYYPQDIEQSVEQCHPDLRHSCTAAFGIEIEGEERLVIVQEVERTALRNFNQQEVIETIRRTVFQDHELQAYAIVLIKPASIPKTSSGKIQRHACRDQFLNNQLKLIINSTMPTLQQPLSKPKASTTETSQQKADKILDWLRDYANNRINSHLIDDRRCVPPYIVMDFGNHGIMGMQIPEQYGGIALNNRDFMRVMEQISAIDLTLATMVSLNNTLGIRPIVNYGTESIKEQLLPLLATGRELSSFGMTEPEAGANIGAISTVAIPDGKDQWRIRGMKRWNGSGWAGMINVFVRLIDPEESGNNGLTGFIVRQGTPGLRLGKESLSMGLRGIMQNAIYFDDVLVTKEQLLGELGNGTEPADDALVYARLGIGMMGVGGMKRCLQLMLRYASRRSVATGRLLENPVTIAKLDHLTGATVATESLLKCVTTALDSQVAVPREMAVIAKIVGADYLWEAADSLMQMMGGRGYMESNLAPQILRDARVLRIGEGPNESLKIFLGKSVTHTQKLAEFLADILDAPELASQLQEATQEINHRCLQLKIFNDRSSAIAWAYSLIGELACYATLVAATAKIREIHPSEKRDHALAWSQLHFEQCLQSARTGVNAETLFSKVETLSERINDYTQSIDDIEQSLAGSDYELDELLVLNPEAKTKINPLAVVEFASKPISNGNEATQTITLNHQTPEMLETWICEWLNKKLKVDPDTIKPSLSFADFGLDSIFAVELAQDITDWCGLEVEATIVWNYPTVEALANYLAEGLNHTDASIVSANLPEKEEVLKVLGQISDEEMSALLGN
ncbi:MAG: AMP-binding protein [Gloeotrichia echinulata DEX184]|nr:AMP-binding protein [Gloeotrichia echinulata DEX184]